MLAKQVGTIDNPGYGTISKKDAERNERNYFDVQALNTAMGSPYVMNQNSFTYNSNTANQQLHYGANYPISTIKDAFEMQLGDAALNYIFNGRNNQLTKHLATPRDNSYIRNVKSYLNNFDYYEERKYRK